MVKIMERYDIVNNSNIQSLVKAEWDTVRSSQQPLSTTWPLVNRRFTKECCGILFYKGTAFASNGHWLMKIRTSEFMFDPDVDHIFFTYDTSGDDDECILENYNPFEQNFGLAPDIMFDTFNDWRKYNVKVRVDDILHLVDEVVPTVRDRRGYALHMGYREGELGMRFETKDGTSTLYTIPAYGYNIADFPELSVNLSYITKILKIVADWYYVVDICFTGSSHDYVIIKAKNRHDDKPDMRFLLGQFNY